MGHGIAQVCAMAGFDVWLTDPNVKARAAALERIRDNLKQGVSRGKIGSAMQKLTLTNLTITDDMAALADEAEIIIESVPEKLHLKQELFSRLEELASVDCLFASNTSSLSIAQLAKPLRHPRRLIGTHFFNPAHIMKLLEVVVTEQTRPEVVTKVKFFGKKIRKEVIIVRDAPGFATSRLGVCLSMEAIRMVEQGIASAEDIDKAMVLGYRHPIGPLRLSDLVGLDDQLSIGDYLAKELNNPAFEPPDLLRQLVQEGRLGQKTGQGFYYWD